MDFSNRHPPCSGGHPRSTPCSTPDPARRIRARWRLAQWRRARWRPAPWRPARWRPAPWRPARGAGPRGGRLDGVRLDGVRLVVGRLVGGRNSGETVPRGFGQSRKRDRERCPAGAARHAHRAVMRGNDGLDDGQAESGAAGSAARPAGPRRIAPGETLEQFGHQIRRDALAVVGDAQLNHWPHACRPPSRCTPICRPPIARPPIRRPPIRRVPQGRPRRRALRKRRR